MGRAGRGIASAAASVALLCAVEAAPAAAQSTLNEAVAARTRSGGQDRLLVDAQEIVYDHDRNTVSASGDVQLSYQGRTLQADRVTYDRNTGRVFATGNARLTDASGAVITGDRFELTDDFKSGFIDSLRVVQTAEDQGVPVTTRFSAPRAERTNGETTVFERGTYTACEPCKSNPERPPLWQVKAARIIHSNTERTVYYENATLEVAGIPVAYLPYFWTPDPTVKRKTGFLAPRYIASTTLGTGVSIPFFWAIAPNYDLTIRPTLLSRQGVLGEFEWRHRLLTGAYNVRGAGIFQQDSGAFLPSPLGPRDRDFRGSFETSGQFFINQHWRWGWDVALLSDKWFLLNYPIRSESLSALYLRESISTLYLQGQGDRSWFDARGYYFRVLSTQDWQKQQPVVHPVVDYNKRVDGPAWLGGELAVEANVTSLTREAAHFRQIPRQLTPVFTPEVLGTRYALYETCSVFERDQCLVRGISGTTSRASVQVSWRRQFIDGVGQSWTPFTYARADGFWVSPDLEGYQNAQLQQFIGGDDEAVGRVMPAVGVEYRFPLVASLGTAATQVLEPIAQVIARPSEGRIGRLPNEDAQSLIFDDTSIFEWDKFSGYDRVEGGVRANVGAQYTVTTGDGAFANALVGQSFQVAGLNSYRVGDLVNVGRDSGLESRRSDVVGRVLVAPNQNLSFLARGRFDQDHLGLNRLEMGVSGTFKPLFPLSASLLYARYEAQPERGYDRRREGVLASGTLNVTQNWFLSGSVLVDLDRYLLTRDAVLKDFATGPGAAKDSRERANFSSVSLGVGYVDECTTFSVNYIMTPREIASTAGEKDTTQTLMFRLELRTLGQANLRQNLGTPVSQDGIAGP